MYEYKTVFFTAHCPGYAGIVNVITTKNELDREPLDTWLNERDVEGWELHTLARQESSVWIVLRRKR